MRAVLQRVSSAAVTVAGTIVGAIGPGILALIGVEQDDTAADRDYLARKIPEMRIFEDEAGLMNLSLCETGGELLLVSQFTLLGDARKGRRPSFSQAARPETAEALFSELVAQLEAQMPGRVATGRFQTMMEVSLVNSGPVTILLDSRKNF
ncbi:MAG: D-tyrosyl-tRNA(Tyr) deacylase [Deltaproteobacteria bacterium ADurb.Bin510]|nr:MAG: D-tyrosyl-tRNA(Tyr) deacylase [Deltaproteobacteria bacterium ADurb.Bin510]